MNLSKPIGLFGGTFDPVHLGHIQIVETLQRDLSFDDIRLVPSYRPLLRDTPSASAEQRLEMLKIAMGHHQGLSIDTREIVRKGTSKTYDTLQSFRKEYPTSPLCWILGLDQWVQLDSWYRWEELVELTHLIVVPRTLNGKKPSGVIENFYAKFGTKNPKDLFAHSAGKIYHHPMPTILISSTDIRIELSLHQSPSDLYPQVYQYIRQHHLYGIAK